MTDFTDGKYVDDRNDRAAYLAAQERQAEYLLDQVRCGPGTRLLDIGCGYGRILEQALAARRSADRHHDFAAAGGGLSSPRAWTSSELNYRNIFRLRWPRLSGNTRFDAIVANGSLEHFVQAADAAAGRADEIYEELFAICRRLLVDGGRFVTTAIHFREAGPVRSGGNRARPGGPACRAATNINMQCSIDVVRRLVSGAGATRAVRGRALRARRRRRRHARLPSHQRVLAATVSVDARLQSARVVDAGASSCGCDRGRHRRCSGCSCGTNRGRGNFGRRRRCGCCGRRGKRSNENYVDHHESHKMRHQSRSVDGFSVLGLRISYDIELSQCTMDSQVRSDMLRLPLAYFLLAIVRQQPKWASRSRRSKSATRPRTSSFRRSRNKKVKLSALAKDGPVVLVVLRGFPGYQCPACSQQVRDFREHAKTLRGAGQPRSCSCIRGRLRISRSGPRVLEGRCAAEAADAGDRSGLQVHESLRPALGCGGRDGLSVDVRARLRSAR